MTNQQDQKLWTTDFTIITIGSVVSMLGNAIASFAIGLLVLDITGSTFLYALYMVVYNVPKVVVPILSGPFLDRFSRKRTIYTLDCTDPQKLDLKSNDWRSVFLWLNIAMSSKKELFKLI